MSKNPWGKAKRRVQCACHFGSDDFTVGGPAIFKDIEWLYFYPSELNRADSMIKLKALLGSLGKFEYDFDGKSIKLYGYK